MKKTIVLASASFIILSVLVLAGLGYFPVARAAGSWILYRDLSRAIAIFNATQKISGAPQVSADVDIRRAVFEELITRSVIKSSLADFGSKETNDEVKSNIQETLAKIDRSQLDQAVNNIYGLSFSEFEDRVILPQVEEIVLEKRVRLSGRDYDPWLGDKLKQAGVKIYFLPYVWRDSRLENK